MHKLAEIGGEWWIVDGSVEFADGDIGDFNHAAIVINHIQSKYMDMESDWDSFRHRLSRERYEELLSSSKNKGKITEQWQKYEAVGACDPFFYMPKLKELGMSDEEISICEGGGDPVSYGVENLGWKRVHGNNIQTYYLTPNDLKNIANGIFDAAGATDEEELADELFTIQVDSTGKTYCDVPWSVLSSENLAEISQYRYR